MGNVIKLPRAGGTPVDVVLNGALEKAEGMSDVIVIGLSHNGSVSIASSSGDIARVIGLTTQAQYRLCGISKLVNK